MSAVLLCLGAAAVQVEEVDQLFLAVLSILAVVVEVVVLVGSSSGPPSQ
jgi:hypothetical protein